MTTRLNTAIVTGAASGIGRAMSLGLLGAGIDVWAVDREASWLAERAAAAGRLAGKLQTLHAELSDPASFDRIVAAVLGAAGRRWPHRHPGQQCRHRAGLDPRRQAAQPVALLGDHASAWAHQDRMHGEVPGN